MIHWRAAWMAILQAGAVFLTAAAVLVLIALSAIYLHPYAALGAWAVVMFCALWGYAYSHERRRQ